MTTFAPEQYKETLIFLATAGVVVPLFRTRVLDRAQLRLSLSGWPTYFIGAGIAVGFAELIDHRAWQLLPVVALPVPGHGRARCAATMST